MHTSCLSSSHPDSRLQHTNNFTCQLLTSFLSAHAHVTISSNLLTCWLGEDRTTAPHPSLRPSTSSSLTHQRQSWLQLGESACPWCEGERRLQCVDPSNMSSSAGGALARTIVATSARPRVGWATRFGASLHQTRSAAPSSHAAVTAVAWASTGAEGPRWDGGETKTAKHQRFRRPTHHARVPEAFAHRPTPLTVTTTDGRDVVVGNPVSTHFKGFRGFETEKGIKHFKHRCACL